VHFLGSVERNRTGTSQPHCAASFSFSFLVHSFSHADPQDRYGEAGRLSTGTPSGKFRPAWDQRNPLHRPDSPWMLNKKLKVFML